MRLKLFSKKRKRLSSVQAEEAAVLPVQAGLLVRRHRKYAVRRVVGESMFPTLQAGELVLAKRRKQYAPDDIVIFTHQGLEKIKRVREVDVSRLYVVGDNPRFSTDSRHYGMVSLEDVLGKVIWPRRLS